jgi:hypothetical protein
LESVSVYLAIAFRCAVFAVIFVPFPSLFFQQFGA